VPAAADLVVANARVLTLDPARPHAEAIAVRAGRILAVGAWAELRALVGLATEVVDAAGGVAVPAFHDAHLHLLRYARAQTRLDCRGARSLAELQEALAAHARELPPGAWVRAGGYDEARLREGRHPDRHDLDAAVPDRPVRLQHRSLHLDVLNSAALRALGPLDGPAPLVERDAATGEPTGRLYHAAALLRDRLPHPDEAELAAAVRAASDRLLAWGVTSVQDASHTNGPAEWALFRRLSAQGALGVRLFMMPGPLTLTLSQGEREDDALTLALSQRERGQGARPVAISAISPWERGQDGRGRRGGARRGRLAGGEWGEPRWPRVLLGPVKVMLDEATSEPAGVRAAVAAAHAAGHAVAIHAVSEAEVALALDALAGDGGQGPRAEAWIGGRRGSGAGAEAGGRGPAGGGRGGSGYFRSSPGRRSGWRGPRPRPPDRIEHGAVIPDAWLDALRGLGVMVVGQPALVAERGDVYRAAYPAAAHGWLHRAGSLLRAGVGYAAGSDAPVTEPAPGLGLYAARARRTPNGAVLGPDERLGLMEALAAFTLGPARAVGMAHALGRLRAGMLADIAVLDPEALEGASPEAAWRPVRLTLMEGRVVWRRAATMRGAGASLASSASSPPTSFSCGA